MGSCFPCSNCPSATANIGAGSHHSTKNKRSKKKGSKCVTVQIVQKVQQQAWIEQEPVKVVWVWQSTYRNLKCKMSLWKKLQDVHILFTKLQCGILHELQIKKKDENKNVTTKEIALLPAEAGIHYTSIALETKQGQKRVFHCSYSLEWRGKFALVWDGPL